ncbi:hypothetical protein RB620_19945 [Paenibacillus sp. LHD-117]|uniref:hypothetical protein n=1 Tax=Paenibacillus sp. LHD-117 TaxID=3071412 RepID=UPI0027E18F34|nr:hypothetical protein [Paenibacillus sp. LHD-117]MDQ6421702.1 hypothetical protein [Paenibacillus sp. LHD-117]
MDNSYSTADLEKILKKLGTDNLIALLSERLTGSELNTLLLNVFREKTKLSSPSDLLKRYRENRFVHPAQVEPIILKRLEIDLLQIAKDNGVTPIQLSPVAPLGSSSVIGMVDQNKVISALRGTEVVPDATNLLALHIAKLLKDRKDTRDDLLRFCTTHRHVRAQFFGQSPGMLPHFHLFCMVTSGVDRGSYGFEIQSLKEHLRVYQLQFQSLFQSKIEVILSERSGYTDSSGFLGRVADDLHSNHIAVSIGAPNTENRYYKGLQFTIKTTIEGKEHAIGDGGFVDWTQQLTGNKKERLLISAIGMDRLIIN